MGNNPEPFVPILFFSMGTVVSIKKKIRARRGRNSQAKKPAAPPASTIDKRDQQLLELKLARDQLMKRRNEVFYHLSMLSNRNLFSYIHFENVRKRLQNSCIKKDIKNKPYHA